MEHLPNKSLMHLLSNMEDLLYILEKNHQLSISHHHQKRRYLMEDPDPVKAVPHQPSNMYPYLTMTCRF